MSVDPNNPQPRALRPGQLGYRKHVPLRDENGKLRGIIEISKEAPPPEQRLRFKLLARMLHQLWFIDQPSPLWVDGKPPASAVTSAKSNNLSAPSAPSTKPENT